MMLSIMLTGLVILGVNVSLGLKKTRLFRIPPLVLEAIGIALAFFSLGNALGVRLWFLLFTGALLVVAIFADPYIWARQGHTSENPRMESFVAAAMLGLIMLSTYLLGAWLT